jgi:hypothetical protein
MKRERDADAVPSSAGYWSLVELPHMLAGHLGTIHQIDKEYRAAMADLVSLSEVFVAVQAGVDGAVLPEGVTLDAVLERIAAAEQAVLQLAAARVRAARNMEATVLERTKQSPS